MIIDQISVFLENKPGQLAIIVNLLADNNIDLKAMSIAETQDYGLLRIIVDRTPEAIDVLQKNDRACSVTPVLAVSVADEPGSLRKILAVLNDNDISLTYSYAFFSRTQGHAWIVLRVDDNANASQLLKEAGIDC